MAYEHLCMYCFEDLEGESICPHCGKDSRAAVPQIQVLPGTSLHDGRFIIGRALGQDASGIVYAAYDTRRENKIKIREYLPRDAARRLNDGSVVPVAGHEDAFEKGLARLQASVEGVEDPRKRHYFFMENGTGYIAQRPQASQRSGEDEEEPEGRSTKQIAIIVGIAAVVVLAVAFLLISLLNNVFDQTDYNLDLTPTSSVESTWAPISTPSPTPYASATFKQIVKLDLEWQNDDAVTGYLEDFTASFENQATPKPASTPNNSKNEIKSIQRMLISVGLMKSGSDDGVYGSATSTAVRQFQQWVNTVLGYERLSVTGSVDSLTKQYLEYCASNGWTVNTTNPTSTPSGSGVGEVTGIYVYVGATQYSGSTIFITDDTVNLSWSATGSVESYYVYIYDSANQQVAAGEAIKSTSVSFPASNLVRGEIYTMRVGVLPTNGDNDDIVWTQARFGVSAEGVEVNTPTPAPTKTVTTAPSQAPTPGNTTSSVINASSSKDVIRDLQSRLITLGLLPSGSADGVYGSATSNAIRQFQQWYNENYGSRLGYLDVTGECDSLTNGYINACINNNIIPGATSTPTKAPSPTQAATPTPKPQQTPSEEEGDEGNITINQDSPTESIKYVQEMLIKMGLMDFGSSDGIYGSSTVNAVRRFQEWINEQNGRQVLNVTGECDSLTLQYIEYCVDNGYVIEAEATPTPVPQQPTQAPQQPTQAPTEQPEEEGNVVVGEGSEPESISYVQNMLIEIGFLPSGSADGNYGSSTVSAVKAFQEWINEQNGRQVLSVTGQCDSVTLQYMEYCWDRGITVGGETAQPDQTAMPQQTEGNQQVGTVSDMNLIFTGDYTPGSVNMINGDSIAISWQAVGDVESYYVRFLGPNGETINSYDAVVETSITIERSKITEGAAYTIQVGAMPENGTTDDIIWAKAQFAFDVAEAPTEAPSDIIPEEGINQNSDGQLILNMQQRLYSLGWITDASSVTQGVLDATTLSAVAAFQQKANELSGAGLTVLTVPEDGDLSGITIDYATLTYLYQNEITPQS